jgi:hypothetical protein
MSDNQERGEPQLRDLDGNPVKLDSEAARAFTEAMNAGDFEPSPPLGLWWSLSRPDGGGVHMRVSEDDNRWFITDVYIHGPRLTATDLQSVPLTVLDLIMNLVGHWDGGGIMDPSLIADAMNEQAGKAGWGPGVMYPDGDITPEPTLAELRDLARDAPDELHAPPTAERPRLTRPDGTDPDGFSSRVADAYREYATQTRAPAIRIAEEAGVPVATARSWIREARRRGKLPQGRKGKAG